jgi:hypothetical protein
MNQLTWKCGDCGKPVGLDMNCACSAPSSPTLHPENEVSMIIDCMGCDIKKNITLDGLKCLDKNGRRMIPISLKDGYVSFSERDEKGIHKACLYNRCRNFQILPYIEKKYIKITIPKERRAEIIDYLNKGQFIQLIKYYRELTNSNLLEGKEWVELFLHYAGGPVSRSFRRYIDLVEDNQLVTNLTNLAGNVNPNLEEAKKEIVDLKRRVLEKEDYIDELISEKEGLFDNIQQMKELYRKRIEWKNRVIDFWKARFDDYTSGTEDFLRNQLDPKNINRDIQEDEED